MSSTKDPLLEHDAAVRSASFRRVVLNIELVGKFIVLNFTIYSIQNIVIVIQMVTALNNVLYCAVLHLTKVMLCS